MHRLVIIIVTALLTHTQLTHAAENGHTLVQDEYRAGTHVEFEEDQDEVYQAVQLGLVKPFSDLYRSVDQQLHGRLIKVELEEDDELWIYELKLIYHDRVFKVEYDAASLEILEIEGRDILSIIKR